MLEKAPKPNWVDLIADWEAGDLSQREYCEKHQLAQNQFTYHRNRLRKIQKKQSVSFAEIKISEPMVHHKIYDIIIEINEGIRLQVPGDRATLSLVLNLLRNK